MGNNNNQNKQGNNKFVENMKEALSEELIRAIIEFLRRMFERGMGESAAISACAANFGISGGAVGAFVKEAKKKK